MPFLSFAARGQMDPLWRRQAVKGKLGAAKEQLKLLLKCCFTSTETVGLSGTGAQDVHLDFHTAPDLLLKNMK